MPHDAALRYIGVWSALTILAIVLVVREPGAYGLLSKAYLRALLVPWKLVTFFLAAGFFVIAAPYTGDPTWDRVDGALMSTLTFVTAPWAVGALARVVRGLLPKRQAFVALVAWLFSASWSYDGYLFLRDGQYPYTWWANLFASSALYGAAGMMWSLTYVSGRGMVSDFMTDDWFVTPAASFRKIAIMATVFGVIVTLSMLPFACEAFRTVRLR
ncbi:MAG: hypothetical protein ABIP39_06875 [Polyangiaceae bacterium]